MPLHGEIKHEKFTAEGGKLTFLRRYIYCVLHGWLDLIAIGGMKGWEERHEHCDSQELPQTRAA